MLFEMRELETMLPPSLPSLRLEALVEWSCFGECKSDRHDFNMSLEASSLMRSMALVQPSSFQVAVFGTHRHENKHP